MWPCTPHIGLAAAMVASNSWLLSDDEGHRFLVDCGHRLERNGLRLGLWRAGVRRPGDLTAVLLTHRHCDHAGNAAWLRRTFECPVCCHEADAPFLTGEQRAQPIKRGIGNVVDEVLCGVEDRWPSRCEVDETFGLGAWRWGFTICPAFGHTAGSVILHHQPTRTAFTGDALLAGPPFPRWREAPFLAIACYSNDVEQCHRHALDFIDDLPPLDTLCAGHGPVITDDTAAKLARFRQEIVGS